VVYYNGKYNRKGNHEYREGIEKHAQWNKKNQKKTNYKIRWKRKGSDPIGKTLGYLGQCEEETI